ncbi:MAG: calcium/proton exchanger [Gammaproteobacteria bacterium]
MTRFHLLLIFVPVSPVLAYVVPVGPQWIFLTATVAIMPLADLVRRGTDQVARRAGSAIGGLLKVSFGNVAEFTLAILVGNWNREKQTFKREQALVDYTERGISAAPNPGTLDEHLSLGISVVLILVYVANLVYTPVTHRDVFACGDKQPDATQSPLAASGVLGVSDGFIAVETELVADVRVGAAEQLHHSPFFLGVTVLAVVGNAAEYVAAIYCARQDRMGMVIGIMVGSTVQVPLLVAPLLVLLPYFLGPPMNLVFASSLQFIAIASTEEPPGLRGCYWWRCSCCSRWRCISSRPGPVDRLSQLMLTVVR